MSTSYVHHRQAPRQVPHHAPRQRQSHGRLLALPLIGGAVVIAAAIAFIVHVLWPAWQGAPLGPNAPALPVTVAGVAFNVPPAAIRVPMQRQPGAQERLDLVFLWPSLAPPEGTPLPNVPTKGLPKQHPLERIFVTIAAAPRDSLSPDERVRTIYPSYVEAEPVAGADGLAVLAFRQGTPYQGEDLVYDGTTPANFLVRCSRNGAAATPGMCFSARRIDGADVTLRFPRDWLKDWRSVASNIERLIAKLRPPSH